MAEDYGAPLRGQALVSDQAPSGLAASRFDPSRAEADDREERIRIAVERVQEYLRDRPANHTPASSSNAHYWHPDGLGARALL